MRLRPTYALLAIAAGIFCPRMVSAQDPAATYPAKPVRLIVAQGAGGSVDVQSRMFAAKLGEALGKPFIVDNRPGRSIAWEIVARAAPDGYTLLAVVPDFTFAPALYQNLPADPIRDFAPVSLTSRAPYLLTVTPSLAAKSIQELIALAKAQPGRLNFGGGLSGSGTHLIAIWFLSLTGAKATYVPYKGGVAQATIDLLAGQIQAGFSTGSTIVHIKSGKLRALGISTATRSTLLPDIPTIAEQGVPGFDASTFHGFAATAGTPPAIIGRLSTELARIARQPEIADKLRADNSEPVGSTPAQFRQFIAVEIPRWRKLVRDSGITVD
jgi:tripartite-type tricarboxylate transporter receptor subunit TctC